MSQPRNGSPRNPRNPRNNTHDSSDIFIRPTLPPWRVLLQADHDNDMMDVVRVIMSLTRISLRDAAVKMLEAHRAGEALLLTTHQERAELFVQQFARQNLSVTIEPATP